MLRGAWTTSSISGSVTRWCVAGLRSGATNQNRRKPGSVQPVADEILKLVTAPSGAVVTTAELKAWLRWDSSEEDSLIDDLILAATEYVEKITGRQLLTATCDLKLFRFPYPSGAITFPLPPFGALSSITYVDTGGASATLASSLYTVNAGSDHERAYVFPAFSQVWPATHGHDRDVTLRFTCGYGEASDIPERLKLQIMLLAGHWFRNRCAVGTGAMSAVPLGFEALQQVNASHAFV